MMQSTHVTARISQRYRGSMTGSLRDCEDLAEETMRETSAAIVDDGDFFGQVLMIIRRAADGTEFKVPQIVDMRPLRESMKAADDEEFARALRILAAKLDAVAVYSLGTTSIGEEYPLLSLVMEHKETQLPRVWYARLSGLGTHEETKVGPWKEPKDLNSSTFHTVLKTVTATIYRN